MIDQLDALLPGLTPWTVALAIIVCFGAAFFGGMSSFGSSVIITLFITPIVGPRNVIPMVSVIMLITNASRIWFLRSSLDLRTALTICAVAVPMAVVGANVYTRLDSNVIQLLLGVMILVSIPLRRWVAAREIRPSTGGTLLVGGLYGFLSAVMVGAGMLIVPVLMGLGLAGAPLIATDAVIATIVNIAKAASFGSLDALTWPMLMVSVAMGLAMIPGTWLAAWVVRRTEVRIHTLFVECVIVLGALGLIFRAVA